MVNEKIKAQELITQIGKGFYGEEFNLDNPKLKAIYKKVYGMFVNNLSNKGKGVFVVGGIGTGKSSMMRIFQNIFKDTDRRFKWVHAYELKDLSEEITVNEIKAYYGYECKTDLYIDDIGFAIDVKRYGNTVNIISELIIERYDLFVTSGYRTHLSSNIVTAIKDNSTTPTIEKLYGVRVLDRIKEMCELISFNGESLRK